MEDFDVKSSDDAVRCLYVARVLAREGRHEAARRWHDKAAGWLKKFDATMAVTTRKADPPTRE